MKIFDRLEPAFVILNREVRDQFRDWRIIAPIIILTLVFPGLMNFTAGQAMGFVRQYGASLIGERFIPFLLMIVGFFPITVSLVIALESFAGETERRSIEPLLSSPIEDWQLYLGKLLASLIPPVVGAYLGIITYLVGVYLNVGWKPEPMFLLQIVMLTTVQALVMVSGAVVVSTQTTSVRAANLLSSFIVIPMSLLIQGEAVVMFWANFDVLWWIIFGQAVIAVLLIRAGIAHFNREDLLGREIDTINFGHMLKTFVAGFVGKAKTFLEWLGDIRGALRKLTIPIITMSVLLVASFFMGMYIAQSIGLQASDLNLDSLKDLNGGLVSGLRGMGFISLAGTGYIIFHNFRVVAIATTLGVVSFGVIGVLIMMLPGAVFGFFAQFASAAGISPLTFLLAFAFPHGLFEFPAIILSGAIILRLGATLVTRTPGLSIGEAFIRAFADWMRVFLVVIVPLFILAALVETFITPYTIGLVLGL